jgi:hypothetical protein
VIPIDETLPAGYAVRVHTSSPALPPRLARLNNSVSAAHRAFRILAHQQSRRRPCFDRAGSLEAAEGTLSGMLSGIPPINTVLS